MRKSAQWNVFFILSLLLGVAASCENNDIHFDDEGLSSNDIDWIPEDTASDTASAEFETEDSSFDTVTTGFETENNDSGSATADFDSSNSDWEPQDTGSLPDPDTGTGTEADTGEEPTDEDPPQDTEPAAEPTILGASHTGWKLPGCWSKNCHSKQTTHNSKLKPHNCAKCHGKNGATQRQPPHFPCVGCHSPIQNHNPTTDFSNTATCAACHG